ncbi:VTT domain-containing protein [Leptospira yasudae]|uniref:VTT domain-containing protein n=1 Tax=Leptospira yasudae TaxID=2202201 RepID=UPI001C50191B|nr:VTT domain-containing protein [Leptospira yasudae]MBW0432566.1 VTT domain-containing protein [Leptospira yasudae]
MQFRKDEIFQYHKKRNFYSGLIFLGSVFLAVILLSLTASGLLKLEIPGLEAIQKLVLFVSKEIRKPSLLGVFFTTLFGGLFFFYLPIEFLYIRAAYSKLDGSDLVMLHILGLVISFTINYFLGRIAARACIKLISPKKFYRMKGFLNRYGVLAIFAFNALPLPAPILSAVLGVIRYKKKIFYPVFVAGQLAQCAVILFFVRFVFTGKIF